MCGLRSSPLSQWCFCVSMGIQPSQCRCAPGASLATLVTGFGAVKRDRASVSIMEKRRRSPPLHLPLPRIAGLVDRGSDSSASCTTSCTGHISSSLSRQPGVTEGVVTPLDVTVSMLHCLITVFASLGSASNATLSLPLSLSSDSIVACQRPVQEKHVPFRNRPHGGTLRAGACRDGNNMH